MGFVVAVRMCSTCVFVCILQNAYKIAGQIGYFKGVIVGVGSIQRDCASDCKITKRRNFFVIGEVFIKVKCIHSS
ncbi:hypothetical protein SAMN04487772_13223 [[Clostridium] polysaccharolyticum]|uniref:Uncharacterized protein n=1 Tax=[Clostridium] polysaccharolyticum TaxID=29364 RepID=A0A1I0FIF2_9FIRM|nr:hypothetical protein SAMN04487772_13223 [[Clostridium] polysaccharolyticum]